MNKNIDERIKLADELSHRQKEIRNEILNHPDISQDFKDEYKKMIEKIELDIIESERELEEYQEKNKDKKIIGYNAETFWPIYEN